MPRKKQIGPCSVEGCDRSKDALGFCHKHYQMWYLYKRTEKKNKGGKRIHPLYGYWFERKTHKVLCDEWLDFWKFVETVGERPTKEHFLTRTDETKPYSSDNFVWMKYLKRGPGEPKKAWYARKWADRKRRLPNFDRVRHIKKKFGLSQEQHKQMFINQNYLCAICNKPETAFDSKNGCIRNLAVDHCHDTGKIRGLLCFKCNSALGKFTSVEMLETAKQYLLKHA